MRKVVIADVQDDDIANSACQEIGGAGPGVSFVHCDVTKDADVRNLVDTATVKHGRLDIMFNNAGTIDAIKQDITEVEQADFERVLAVNLTGVFLGIKHAVRVMAPAGRGSIINTASVCGVVGGVATHAYTASKHAVVGLTKNAAVELGRYGVRVNAVSPYVVSTPLSDCFFEELGAKPATMFSNLRGWSAEVEEIANAVVYLGSDEAKYVSGHNLVVDGGFSVQNTALSMYHS